MKITVIGSGYVGLVAAACFAELGHTVSCVDSDAKKINVLEAGGNIIHEEYLPELLARHRGRSLTFTTSFTDALRDAYVIVVAVGTPATASGEADLSNIECVTRLIA